MSVNLNHSFVSFHMKPHFMGSVLVLLNLQFCYDVIFKKFVFTIQGLNLISSDSHYLAQ